MVVSATGVGSALAVDTRVTIAEPSSVSGGCVGSALGTYSCTVPRTCTRLPTAASAGGAALVNTNTPSDVIGSASASASGICTKKPLLRRAVTMALVMTVWPTSGELLPLPWMSCTGTTLKSSLRMVPVACSVPGNAPVTLLTSTKKVSSASLPVSPMTCTVTLALSSPSAMVTGVVGSAV